MNTAMRTRSTAMPARREASALPPTAYTCRPKRVRDAMKDQTTRSARRITVTFGTPRSLFTYQTAAKVTAARPRVWSVVTTIGLA
jgi:hypothetical protein